jgi:hypothetical protein
MDSSKTKSVAENAAVLGVIAGTVFFSSVVAIKLGSVVADKVMVAAVNTFTLAKRKTAVNPD